MLKKTITYTDYNGKERTEDYYFNLNKKEILQLSLDISDDDELLSNKKTSDEVTEEDTLAIGEKIFNKLGRKGVLVFIEKVILNSYGIRTEDGRGFRKSEELKNDFSYSLAFDKIFDELVDNPNEFTTFMEGIAPSNFKIK